MWNAIVIIIKLSLNHKLPNARQRYRKRAFISIFSLNLTRKQYHDIYLELLHRIEFYPEQLKNVGENEAKRFCFALTLWSPGKFKAIESDINGISQWCV